MAKPLKHTIKRSPNDELRWVAHEVIIKLWEAKDRTAINLLKMHCDNALKALPDPL